MHLKVAIIDDNKTFREVLKRSLSNLNCDVTDYPHPTNLLESEFIPELILLDMQLESDTGLQWIQKLRSKFATTKIILLTAYASIATAVEAIKLGADDYLTKPCTAREILAHVEVVSTADDNFEIPEQVMSVNRLEWEHIQRVLMDHDGNISAAARALGMHRRTLQRKLQKKPAKG